jgi:hypothetical protein
LQIANAIQDSLYFRNATANMKVTPPSTGFQKAYHHHSEAVKGFQIFFDIERVSAILTATQACFSELYNFG